MTRPIAAPAATGELAVRSWRGAQRAADGGGAEQKAGQGSAGDSQTRAEI